MYLSYLRQFDPIISIMEFEIVYRSLEMNKRHIYASHAYSRPPFTTQRGRLSSLGPIKPFQLCELAYIYPPPKKKTQTIILIIKPIIVNILGHVV